MLTSNKWRLNFWLKLLGLLGYLLLSSCSGGQQNQAQTPAQEQLPAPVPVQPTTAPLSSGKDIIYFAIGSIEATIEDNSIKLSLPYGSSLTNLVATFITTGQTVKVHNDIQRSDQTANNFDTPLTYIVTAQDGSSKNYEVKVSVDPSPEKEMLEFKVSPAAGAAIIAQGNISDNEVLVTLPSGTISKKLVATFKTSNHAKVKVGNTLQVSGQTVNDFNNPLNYNVIAEDGSIKQYRVTVRIAKSSEKNLTSFKLSPFDNPTQYFNGEFNANAISITIPSGIDFRNLIATFSIAGEHVQMGDIFQDSGKTANNFSAPVKYTVYAADGSTQDYWVTVKPYNLMIFATNNEYTGNLGGFAGANQKCTNEASTRNFGNKVFKALLNGNHATTLNYNYYQTNRETLIAQAIDSDGNLVGNNSLRAIIPTKKDVVAWIGAFNNLSCQGWSASSRSVSGGVGKTNITGGEWFQWGTSACDSMHPIYCVEQFN